MYVYNELKKYVCVLMFNGTCNKDHNIISQQYIFYIHNSTLLLYSSGGQKFEVRLPSLRPRLDCVLWESLRGEFVFFAFSTLEATLIFCPQTSPVSSGQCCLVLDTGFLTPTYTYENSVLHCSSG